jgi:hypothetical protein
MSFSFGLSRRSRSFIAALQPINATTRPKLARAFWNFRRKLSERAYPHFQKVTTAAELRFIFLTSLFVPSSIRATKERNPSQKSFGRFPPDGFWLCGHILTESIFNLRV